MNAQRAHPFHPSTGLQAAGYVNGRPVWPIRGGSGDEQEPDPASGGDDSDAQSEDESAAEEDQPLGPKGQKAYEAEKAKRRAESARRRELERELQELKSKQNAGEQSDLDELKRQTEREVTSKMNARILRAELKAAAGGKLADPDDAPRFIDLSEFEPDKDGNFETGEIQDAIKTLLEKKPYLAAAQGGRKPNGSADGGARNGSRPSQLTREQLKSMSPDDIEKARQEGRLNDVLGIK